MKKLLILAVAAAMAIAAQAQGMREEIKAHPEKAAGVYSLYPTEFAALTPAPKGYKPFYISHYGRHGSRYILRNYKFDDVFNVFADADKAGKLTPFGKDVYARMQRIADVCQGLAGDLTPLGQEQHRGIAKRMYEGYPDVFRHSPHISSVATTVPRCLLSMNAFTNELLRHDPTLDITLDTGAKHMAYLNPYFKDNNAALSAQIDKYRFPAGPWVDDWYAFRRATVDNTRLLHALFAADFADGLEFADNFVINLFRVTVNTPNTPAQVDMSDIFTPDEKYTWWRLINVIFYYEKGPSGTGGGFIDEVPANLLKQLMDDATEKVAAAKPAVTLRFGHDGVLMGLYNFMRLRGWSDRAAKMEEVENSWHDYDIPMAANLQWIFYRNAKTGDVLVKMLQNEREAEFPIESDMKPYYHWNDVKAFYDKVLSEQTLYRFSRPSDYSCDTK